MWFWLLLIVLSGLFDFIFRISYFEFCWNSFWIWIWWLLILNVGFWELDYRLTYWRQFLLLLWMVAGGRLDHQFTLDPITLRWWCLRDYFSCAVMILVPNKQPATSIWSLNLTLIIPIVTGLLISYSQNLNLKQFHSFFRVNIFTNILIPSFHKITAAMYSFGRHRRRTINNLFFQTTLQIL